MSTEFRYTTDDLGVDTLRYFKYFDMIKQKHSNFKMTAFIIAKDLPIFEFTEWFVNRRDWVEVGVHCWEHTKPQEGWRSDQADYIKKARDILIPFLPNRYLYRAPGFRVLPKTEKVLRELGFAGIAHQEFIKYFDTGEQIPVWNSHCTETEFFNPIGQVWKQIVSQLSLSA